MQPSKLSEFMTSVRDRFEQAAREGEAPVLVTSAAIRPFVRSLVERFQVANHGAVAGGNPSARAAEDGRKRLTAGKIDALSGGTFSPQANDLSAQAMISAPFAAQDGRKYYNHCNN